MYDARSVANEFLRKAQESGRTLTNMQLQKLVYIAHGYTLAILHYSLIKQSVEALRYGPVISDLYHALRQYGAGVVREPINRISRETISETDQALIASVLNAYGRFSGTQLSTMTHREGTPWHEVFNPHAFFNNDQISNDLIQKHYIKLLHDRAGITPA